MIKICNARGVWLVSHGSRKGRDIFAQIFSKSQTLHIQLKQNSKLKRDGKILTDFYLIKNYIFSCILIVIRKQLINYG